MRHSLYVLYLCPCLDLCLFISNLCDLFLIFIFIFIIVNRIISWIQTHTFLCLFLEFFLLLLDENLDEECEWSSASRCCLAFSWFFANFSLALLIKVLLIKKSVYIVVPSLRLYFNSALSSLWIVSSKMLSRKFTWQITEAVSQTNHSAKGKISSFNTIWGSAVVTILIIQMFVMLNQYSVHTSQ